MIDKQVKRLNNGAFGMLTAAAASGWPNEPEADLKQAKLESRRSRRRRRKRRRRWRTLEMKNDAGTRHLKEVVKNEEEQMVATTC